MRRIQVRVAMAALAGIAVAGAWSTIDAQQPTRRRTGVATSELRLPLRKDTVASEGRVVSNEELLRAQRAREDSIAQAEAMRRQQEIAQALASERARLDSIARETERKRQALLAAERSYRDSVETANYERLMARRLGPSGLYWGIAAGASFPTQRSQDAYNSGVNVTIPFGLDLTDIPVGLRFDAMYDHQGGEWISTVGGISDITVYSLNADLKVRKRFTGRRMFGGMYLLGGGGVHRLVSQGGIDRVDASLPEAQTNNGFATTFGDARTRWGWNAGAGVSLDFGRSTIFVESRYFSVDTKNPFLKTSTFVPLVLGVNF